MTQDSSAERRRKYMAVMDDRKGKAKIMTKLRRFNFVVTPTYFGGSESVMRVIDPAGEYVRFADVEAYTQAAVAAALQGAAIAAGNEAVAIVKGTNPAANPLKLQILRVKLEKAVKASIPTDATAALEAMRRSALELPEVTALFDALVYMVNHAEWREQNDGVFWEATNLARAAIAAIRAMKGGA